jgi:hypothetical protein
MFKNLGNLSRVKIKWQALADLPNCVLKKQLHFMALIHLKTLEKFAT